LLSQMIVMLPHAPAGLGVSKPSLILPFASTACVARR
jgi:hypothetical protein